MNQYDFRHIEKKWQENWGKSDLYKAEDFSKKPKYYCLVEFPYPSGEGLHVGHPKSYTALDVIARKKRMQGYNVLFPMGWDAFGLPTENYAIKMGKNPMDITKENIQNFKRQLKSLGLSFDWNREIDTTDPEYYKWTQWIFLKLYEKGLAYKAEIAVNWCPDCKINLANEEVINECCERCGAETEIVKRKQWLLKITEYADELLDGLKQVDFLERIKKQQANWIGRSEGSLIFFKIQNSDEKIEVYTTRPDTVFGATYLVLAPENEIISKIVPESKKKEVSAYCKQARRKGERQRKAEDKVKSGVFTGAYAINPANNEKIPVWISEYVLISYGTGAIMGVPAHDQRDWEFAKEYDIPMRKVISNDKSPDEGAYEDTEKGALINSDFLNGLTVSEAIKEISKCLEEKNAGKSCIVKYSLRDWVFSRQHYWGEPIPIVICEKCGYVPVPYEALPVKLPYVEKYEPTGTGESPLANITEWVSTTCPKCGDTAKRETDTMPNWAGSSWYFLRYIDAHNNEEFADMKKMKYWLPVDLYNGGMEHTTLHLLYSRFWHKVMYDLKLVPTPEPYAKRISHGLVLVEDGKKMSKSKGNVINPDRIVEEYGADVFRGYELFMGAFDQASIWDTKGIEGIKRFVNRIWNLFDKIDMNKKPDKSLLKFAHVSIKNINKRLCVEISNRVPKFNTALAQLMEFANEMTDKEPISGQVFEIFLKLLSPFMPHISEELWEKLGHEDSIFKETWPVYDKDLVKQGKVNLVVQVNGKLRANIEVDVDISDEDCRTRALDDDNVKNIIRNKKMKKIIVVGKNKASGKNRLVNIVI